MTEEKGLHFTQATAELVRQLVNHPAWTDFFVPSLESMKNEWMVRLTDPGKDRKDIYPDDYIRGCYTTINAFLGLAEDLLAAADRDRERDDQERAVQEDLTVRADSGRVGPI